MDSIPSQKKTRSMILKHNRILVLRLAPVLHIRAHRPRPAPLNGDIVDYWIEFGGDIEVFAFREYDFAVVAADGEGAGDVVDV